MEDVLTKGTGKPARFTTIDMAQAGKTGTTSSDIDLWFEGYTPYYTAGIWGGWDLNKDQADTVYHKNIWKTIMEKVHTAKKKKKKDFKIPDSVTEATICTSCGKLAISGVCSAYGAAKTEYFAKDMLSQGYCTCHSAPKPKPEPEPGTNDNPTQNDNTVSPDSAGTDASESSVASQAATPSDTGTDGSAQAPADEGTVTQNYNDIAE